MKHVIVFKNKECLSISPQVFNEFVELVALGISSMVVFYDNGAEPIVVNMNDVIYAE